MMQTKTITISTDSIFRTILYTIVAVIAIPLIYIIAFHGWVYYILYEWGQPLLDASIYRDESGHITHSSSSDLASVRIMNMVVWFGILLAIGILSLDGNSLYREWEIKVPVLFNFSNDKDEILEMYKQAASYTAEGRQEEADEIYDKINEMEGS